ncbi:putative type I restriction enzyme specificity protein [Pectobacterium carotovorum subsp. carotovorum]|uniref:Restriction endonuclease subunit S n=1 Tax=Pectobacterium polonicum TaxID=2485124 RepID=A0ABV1P9K1_9GAMM|nr:restriction endonuclease subunit S [Pectobacterium polonicum]MDC9818456.1 restriction endonuclease subunit S [Pectobacterium polonicum]GKW13717.1 putative type I restriction enzyme specificity protein [Pectobacterium carotovorum subsp. carotovorum]
MSEQDYLVKLLDGVDVEWKLLGDASFFEIANNGRKPVKSSLRVAGKTPYYGANNIQDYVDGYTHDGEYVLIAEDGSASLERYSIQYTTGKFWANNHVHVVRGKSGVNSRFLYHYLHIVNFIPFLTGGVRSKLTKGQLIEIPVPIPCPDNPEKSLAIQSEIVRILDKFTSLTAELTAELTMRKKQYSYYRDQLLSFEEGEMELKALDDVCALISAGGDVPENSVKGQLKPTIEYPYPIYANATDEKGLYGYTDSYKIDSDAVTISARGAKVGYHTVRDEKFTPIIRLIVLVADKNLVRTRYLNYVLDMTAIGGTDGGIPQLTVPMVKKITIPIPFASNPNRSLAEQDRIIAILDKFEILTNSISEGLPREINLRQKQYEYYRDLLLSFPKPNVQEVA